MFTVKVIFLKIKCHHFETFFFFWDRIIPYIESEYRIHITQNMFYDMSLSFVEINSPRFTIIVYKCAA